MFGRSQQTVLPSFGHRRSRWRLPRWLVLLLCGMAAGAAAVIVVQQRYLPPRLSAMASAELRTAFELADAERRRSRDELAELQRQLAATVSQGQALATELADSRAAAASLRDSLATVVASLPPDPRSGAVAVRAGRFTADGGRLSYDIVLTRESVSGRPLPGTLQLVVAGESSAGAETTVVAKPIAVSVGSHEVLRGSLPLPAGFKPRQTTVRVLGQPAGQALGMRVLRVQ